mgnify:FL=1
MANETIFQIKLPDDSVYDIQDTNTTYTFTGGTNSFSVTPSGGSAQTVTVTPSITDNITGSGTSGYLAKFDGTNTITNGPQLGSDTTTFLRNDGTWATVSATVSVTDKAPTLAWSTQSTVATIEGTDIHVTMPANPNTNNAVTQNLATTNTWRKILATNNTGSDATTSITSGTTSSAYYGTDISMNPSTGAIHADLYYMALATTDSLYTAINNVGWVSEVIV